MIPCCLEADGPCPDEVCFSYMDEQEEKCDAANSKCSEVHIFCDSRQHIEESRVKSALAFAAVALNEAASDVERVADPITKCARRWRMRNLVGHSEFGRGPRDRSLAWWFRAGCFCFTAVGMDMAWHLDVVKCNCSSYPWRIEAVLLVLQGFLSYLHDAHFQGRSRVAQISDRTCATFLASCQPLKFAFCTMDFTQASLLIVFFTLGLLCFRIGCRANVAGDSSRYQVFHSLWHLLLPLGGILWIEYTQTLVLARLSSRSSGLSKAETGVVALGAMQPELLCSGLTRVFLEAPSFRSVV